MFLGLIPDNVAGLWAVGPALMRAPTKEPFHVQDPISKEGTRCTCRFR